MLGLFPRLFELSKLGLHTCHHLLALPILHGPFIMHVRPMRHIHDRLHVSVRVLLDAVEHIAHMWRKLEHVDLLMCHDVIP